MKNSGIEWIGEIPDGWKLNKIGQLFNLRNEKVSDKLYAPLSVSRGGIVPQMESVAKSDASDDRKLVLAGDFAINSRSDRKQSCGVSPLDGSVSLINLILYLKDKSFVYTDYLNYLLKNYGFAEEFYRWGHGIVADLWTTRWQEMKMIVLPIPSVAIQQNIVALLNKKLAETDKLIEVQEVQIEKLKEYKQSVITEAVTKGLDKSAPMKDSGIEWIGEIPENWEVGKIQNYGKVINGYAFPSNAFIKQGVRVVKIANIQLGEMLWEDESYVDESYYEELTNYRVENNDLVFALTRPIINGGIKVALVQCKEKLLLNQRNAVFKVNTKMLGKFLFYLFQCESFIQEYKLNIDFTGLQPNISATDILNIKIQVASIDEQKQIVLYLDEKCAKIDNLIAIKQQKIEKLQEYKKSLIYEYVTGKKEVV